MEESDKKPTRSEMMVLTITLHSGKSEGHFNIQPFKELICRNSDILMYRDTYRIASCVSGFASNCEYNALSHPYRKEGN